MKSNLVIIDDENKSRIIAREIINSGFRDRFNIKEAGSVKEGTAILKDMQPEIVLLDIDLGDGSAFDLLNQLNEIHFKIIFITAYDVFAIKAFKFSAIDYLLKPVVPSELISAVEKAIKSIDNDNIHLKLNAFLTNMANITGEIKKIVLKTSDSIHLINIRDIIRLESDSNYTWFHIMGNKKLFVSKTLKDYEEMLGNSGFFRPHQSHLVNISFIDRFEKGDGGILILRDGTNVPVSYRKKENLLKIFESLSKR